MDVNTTQITYLILAWLFYFIIHSALASMHFKALFSRLLPKYVGTYRLFYNIVAALLLFPILVMIRHYSGDPLWQWAAPASWLANGLALLALVGFIWSLRYYDSREFLGFTQLSRKDAVVDHHDTLKISPLHRFVRHPWYSFALVIIWTRDMDAAFLTSAIMMTLYFIVGSRFEEGKLVRYYGETYQIYQRRVPALFPSPWHYLTDSAAESLEEKARKEKTEK